MSAPQEQTRHRVVQWTTGNIGTGALRAVIEHPTLELAGVYVHSPDKAGRDAGELCGLDPTGVLATGDIEDVVARCRLRPEAIRPARRHNPEAIGVARRFLRR